MHSYYDTDKKTPEAVEDSEDVQIFRSSAMDDDSISRVMHVKLEQRKNLFSKGTQFLIISPIFLFCIITSPLYVLT